MSKKASTIPDKYMYEKVDKEVFKKLMSCEDVPSHLREQLTKYYESINENGENKISYYHSKFTPNMGRLFPHGLSLGIEKEYRCALAKDIYYDIDMANAIPNLLLQYCMHDGIMLPSGGSGLEYYVQNRDDVLDETMEKHNLDRDQAKVLINRLCNGGAYILERSDENGIIKKQFIKSDHKHKNRVKTLHYLSVDCRNIAQKIYDTRKDLKKLADNKLQEVFFECENEEEDEEYSKYEESKKEKKLWVRAMCLNNYDLENDCLMAMLEFFEK
jgi:hypothetical protein